MEDTTVAARPATAKRRVSPAAPAKPASLAESLSKIVGAIRDLLDEIDNLDEAEDANTSERITRAASSNVGVMWQSLQLDDTDIVNDLYDVEALMLGALRVGGQMTPKRTALLLATRRLAYSAATACGEHDASTRLASIAANLPDINAIAPVPYIPAGSDRNRLVPASASAAPAQPPVAPSASDTSSDVLDYLDGCQHRLRSARGIMWMLTRLCGEIPEDERGDFSMFCLSLQYVGRVLTELAEGNIPDFLRVIPPPEKVMFFDAISEGRGIALSLDAMLFADGWQQMGSDDVMDAVLSAISSCIDAAIEAVERVDVKAIA